MDFEKKKNGILRNMEFAKKSGIWKQRFEKLWKIRILKSFNTLKNQ